MQKHPKFIKDADYGINMAKRKSKKKSAKKADPLTTPIHWSEGDIIKKSAIVKLFPKDTMVQPLWGGREGKLSNILSDPDYIVSIARVNKDKSWRTYSLRSENIIFGFSEGVVKDKNFHRFVKPLVRIADVPKGDKGRVKKTPKKPKSETPAVPKSKSAKKSKGSKGKKTSRPKKTT
jgi:hypothetical protein